MRNQLDLCQKLAALDLPECAVSFRSDDRELKHLMAKAELKAAENIVQFSPAMK